MTSPSYVRRALAAAGTCLVLALGVVVAAAPGADALTCPTTATKTWNGGTGAWTDDARWSPTGVPTAADTVRVQTGTTIMTGLTGSVCSLVLDPAGGKITVSGALDVLGDLAFGVGTVAADTGLASAPALHVGGNVALAANATLDGVALQVAGGQLDLAGRTLTLTGPANSRLENGASVTSSSNGGLMVVKAGAGVVLTGSTTIATPAVLQLQDGSVLATEGSAALAGTGILNWQAGQVGGDLTLTARTVLDGTLTRVVPAGSRLTNAGVTDVTGGTLRVDGAMVNPGTLRVYPGAQLTSSTGAGSLTSSGALVIGSADTVAGSGDVALASLPFRSSGVVSIVTGTRLLVTGGSVRLDPTSVVRDPYPGSGPRGVLQIGTGAGLTVAGDATLQQGAVLRLDGAGATLTGEAGSAAQLQGSGTLDWRSGTVAGAVTVQAETSVVSGGVGTQRLLSGNLALSGPGSVDSTQVTLTAGSVVHVLDVTALVGPGAGFARSTPALTGQVVTVAPTGTLRRPAPADPATAPAVVDVKVVNNGSLAVAGDLRLQAGFSQVKAAGPDPAAVPDPVTSLLGGARLSALDGAGHRVPLELAAGGLGGSGTVAATKLTLGSTWLHPGFQSAAGSIRVEGDLALSAGSDVQLVLRDAGAAGQPKESDTLVVAGRANLAGRVTGVSAGSYKPAYGTTVHNLIRYTARSGGFGKASSFGTPAGLGWRPRYDSSTDDGDGPAVDLRLSDVAPPALGLARIPAFTQKATQRVTYAAVDNRTGVATYDGRWREGRTAAKTFGAWHRPKAWQHSKGTSRMLTDMRPGRTYCFSVRVRDRAGNTSAWTQPLCTARMLDDAALAASKGWARLSGRPGFYAGTLSRSSQHGAELRRHGTFTRVAVTAVRCPTCGTLRVLAGGKVLKTLSLKGKRTEVFTWVSPVRTRSEATVRLRVVSAGKPVAIDSFGLSR